MIILLHQFFGDFSTEVFIRSGSGAHAIFDGVTGQPHGGLMKLGLKV